MRKSALTILKSARKHSNTRVPLELITMALAGKKVNFDKVLKMIDELVAALGKEQSEDDHKKEYCEGQIDHLEDKKKELLQAVADLETLIDDTKEKIATTA